MQKKIISSALTMLAFFILLMPFSASAQYYDPYAYNPYGYNYDSYGYGYDTYGYNNYDSYGYNDETYSYTSYTYMDGQLYRTTRTQTPNAMASSMSPVYNFNDYGYTYGEYPYGNYHNPYEYQKRYVNNKSSKEELKYITDLDGNIIGEYKGGPNSYKPVIRGGGTYQPNVITENTSKKTATISMRDNKYSPATITVKKGTTVKWINYDKVRHTVTGSKSTDNINSKALVNGDSYSKTFNKVGTFHYYDKFTGTMRGKVIVTN
jgi:plastocyanin